MITEGPEAYYAGMIVSLLKSTYNVYIQKDWGIQIIYPYPLADGNNIIPLPGGIRCEWQEGAWKLRELSWVNDAIHLTANAMGGADKFKAAMQEVRISRWNISTIIDIPEISLGSLKSNRVLVEARSFSPPYRTSHAFGDLVLTDYGANNEAYFKHTVIHELGHVWDFRTGNQLSAGLQNFLGTKKCYRVKGVFIEFRISNGTQPMAKVIQMQ